MGDQGRILQRIQISYASTNEAHLQKRWCKIEGARLLECGHENARKSFLCQERNRLSIECSRALFHLTPVQMQQQDRASAPAITMPLDRSNRLVSFSAYRYELRGCEWGFARKCEFGCELAGICVNCACATCIYKDHTFYRTLFASTMEKTPSFAVSPPRPRTPPSIAA